MVGEKAKVKDYGGVFNPATPMSRGGGGGRGSRNGFRDIISPSLTLLYYFKKNELKMN